MRADAPATAKAKRLRALAAQSHIELVRGIPPYVRLPLTPRAERDRMEK